MFNTIIYTIIYLLIFTFSFANQVEYSIHSEEDLFRAIEQSRNTQTLTLKFDHPTIYAFDFDLTPLEQNSDLTTLVLQGNSPEVQKTFRIIETLPFLPALTSIEFNNVLPKSFYSGPCSHITQEFIDRFFTHLASYPSLKRLKITSAYYGYLEEGSETVFHKMSYFDPIIDLSSLALLTSLEVSSDMLK